MKLTPEETEEIREQLNSLRTYQSIATEYGVSRERIRQIARGSGLANLGARKRKERRIEEDFKAKASRWGHLYTSTGAIEDVDFARICKAKFRRKQYQVSKQTSWEWDLHFKDIEWNRVCPILGVAIDYNTTELTAFSPSFDRTDSTKGYVKGNVVIVSWRANMVKNIGTAEEHQKIASYLTNIEKCGGTEVLQVK